MDFICENFDKKIITVEKMNSLVSVIIPTYNRLEYICEAVESVLAQTYRNYEIIVVDDGSKINIKSILIPYWDKIKYVYQKHKGLAAARNTGIRISSGKYLAFLDDDDLFEPDKLQNQTLMLKKDSSLGFVYSDCYELWQEKNKKEINQAVRGTENHNDLAKEFFLCPNIRTPTVLFNKNSLKSVGLFDETLKQHEDGDLLLRMLLKFNARYSSYPSAIVRHHESNMSANRVQMYDSLIVSSKKILLLFPEFKKSLGIAASKRLIQLYYRWARAYLSQVIKRGIG